MYCNAQRNPNRKYNLLHPIGEDRFENTSRLSFQVYEAMKKRSAAQGWETLLPKMSFLKRKQKTVKITFANVKAYNNPTTEYIKVFVIVSVLYFVVIRQVNPFTQAAIRYKLQPALV